MNFVWDVVALIRQLLPPPPVTLGFRKYEFSRADLPPFAATIAADGRASPSPLASQFSPDGDGNDRCGSAGSNRSFVATARFDVLTYNVDFGVSQCPERRRSVVRAIVESESDVVLLQETNPDWENALLFPDGAIDDDDDDGGCGSEGSNDGRILAARYKHRHFHHPSSKIHAGGRRDRPAGGMAILSRHPLRNIEVVDARDDVPGSVFPSLVAEVLLPLRRRPHVDPVESATGDGTRRRERRPRPEERGGKEGETESTSVAAVEASPCAFAPLRVANVHLRPPLELDGSAWLHTARETESIRLSEARRLFMWRRRQAGTRTTSRGREGEDTEGSSRNEGIGKDECQNEGPFAWDIIAGDFNEGDDGGAISWLTTRNPYRDALSEFVPRSKETHRWPFYGGTTLRKRLDRTLWRDDDPTSRNGNRRSGGEVSRAPFFERLDCLGCGVLTGYEEGASDHQPVVTRFEAVMDAVG